MADDCLHCDVRRTVQDFFDGADVMNVKTILEALAEVAAEMIAACPDPELREETVATFAADVRQLIPLKIESGHHPAFRMDA